jgi:hypothetical protein
MKSALINIRVVSALIPASENKSEAVRDLITAAIARGASVASVKRERGESTTPLSFRLEPNADAIVRSLAHDMGVPITAIVHGLLVAGAKPVTLAVTQAKRKPAKRKPAKR